MEISNEVNEYGSQRATLVGEGKMNRKNPLQSKREGFAMAIVLLMVVILLVMGVGLLSLGFHGQMLAIRTSAEIASRTAADAGLTKALFEMNEKLKVSAWDSNTLPYAVDEPLANCDATFSYTVTGDANSGFAIESIGSSGLAERRINSTLRLQGLFENAILAQNSIVLENNTSIDAYDSNDGVYGGDNALQQTSIATCSESPGTILNNAALYGDVTSGYEVELPQVLPPTGAQFDVSKGAITTSTTLGQEDSGRYDYITLEPSETLSIIGDVTLYVTGDILIGQSHLEIQTLPDSSLTLYVGGNFTARNTTLINTITKEPKRCLIYGVGSNQTFMLEQSTVLYGIIYAPDSNVYLDNSAELYGAIIANNVELSNSSNLHYDGALGEVSFGDMGVWFVVQHWQEE